MAINYLGFVRRRIESQAAALRGNVYEHRGEGKSDEDVAWLLTIVERIYALCDEIEEQEPRYQTLEPTAPPH